MSTEKLLLTYPQAAKLAGYSTTVIREAVKAGKLHPVTLAHAPRIRKSELLALIGEAAPENGGRV